MGKQAVVTTNEFGTYYVPFGLEQRPASKAVLNGGVYEPKTIKFMRDHAGTGDVIHAGAFFGDFIPALSSALAPDAKLWAYEPNPSNFAAAQYTVEMNKLRNVKLTNAALSSRDDRLLFKTQDEDGKSLGGLSHYTEEEGPGVEPVSSVMLDYHVGVERPVSVLQLDVEGHEKQALRGAFHIISRWKPILILEYFDKLRWIQRNFQAGDYVKVGKLHSNYVFAPADSGITL